MTLINSWLNSTIKGIELFAPKHIASAFSFSCNPSSCNNPDHFQEYLLYNAISDYKNGLGVTYILPDIVDEQIYISGFFTLKAACKIWMGQDNCSYIGEPAIEIAQLAVDQHYERCGVGKLLVNSAILLIDQIRHAIGVRHVLVCAEPNAVGFYKKVQNFVDLTDIYSIPRETWNQDCIPLCLQLEEI